MVGERSETGERAPSTTIARAVSSYLALAADTRSPRTLPMLRSDLADLTRFLASEHVTTTDDLRRMHLHAWHRALEARKLAASTRARKISHVRGWCAHLAAEVLTAGDLSAWLRRPDPPRKQRAPAALDVVRLIEATAGDDLLSLRDSALIEILYATGVRASEVVALRVGDVATDAELLRVPGRRPGQAVLPVHRSAIVALRRYLSAARPGADAGEPLFVSRRGTPLRERDLRARVSAIGRRAGLRAVTPDRIRRQLAVDLAARGADVRAIAQLLGHARLSTTRQLLRRPRTST